MAQHVRQPASWLTTYKAKYRTQLDPFRVIHTGIFTMDLAIGGGLGEGYMHTFTGWESSGKTSTAWTTIAQYQKKYPHRRIVVFDCEGRMNQQWAETLGVRFDAADCEEPKLVVFQTSVCEEIIEIVQQFHDDLDLGLLIIDSLAMIKSAEELANPGKHNIGITAKRQSDLGHVIMQIQNARRTDNEALLTCLVMNQLRNKIGVVYGDPTKTVGSDFFTKYSMVNDIRMSKGKVKELSAAEAKALGLDSNLDYIEHTFRVQKTSQALCRKEGAYTRSLREQTETDYGEVNNISSILEVAKGYGYYQGAGKGQYIVGVDEKFSTMAAAREYLTKNPYQMDFLAAKCIARARFEARHEMLPKDRYLYRFWENDFEL